jgi:hypothetical protein
VGITLTREGHTFTLSWPTPLPAPTLSGDSATYADVLPDVDGLDLLKSRRAG